LILTGKDRQLKSPARDGLAKLPCGILIAMRNNRRPSRRMLMFVIQQQRYSAGTDLRRKTEFLV
jgi:hypothetical protein